MRRYERAIPDSDHCLRIRQIITDTAPGSIKPDELARRVEIERFHDSGTCVATNQNPTPPGLEDAYLRCHVCGALIGIVEHCPACNMEQRHVGQRIQARKHAQKARTT